MNRVTRDGEVLHDELAVTDDDDLNSSNTTSWRLMRRAKQQQHDDRRRPVVARTQPMECFTEGIPLRVDGAALGVRAVIALMDYRVTAATPLTVQSIARESVRILTFDCDMGLSAEGKRFLGGGGSCHVGMTVSHGDRRMKVKTG